MASIRRSSRPRAPQKATEEHRPVPSNYADRKVSLSNPETGEYPKTGRRGAPQVFPRKLYEILGNEDHGVIEWTPSGCAFNITNMDEFCGGVLMHYFRHDKYSSFQRQLNLYGFRKVAKGPDVGAYAHPRFLRGRLDLLPEVRRLPQGHAHTALPTPTGRHTLVLPAAASASAHSGKHRPSPRPAGASDSEGASSSDDERHDANAHCLVATAVPAREPVFATPLWRPPLGKELSEESAQSVRGVSELYPEAEEADDHDFAFNHLELDPAAMVSGCSGDGVVRTQPLPGAMPLALLHRTASSATAATHGQKTTHDLSLLSAKVHKLALLVAAEPSLCSNSNSSSAAPGQNAWAKPLPLALANDEPALAGIWRVPALPSPDRPPPLGRTASISAAAAGAHSKLHGLALSPRSASAPSALLPVPAWNGRITSEQWDVGALAPDGDLGLLTNEDLDSLFARQASAVVEPPVAVEMQR